MLFFKRSAAASSAVVTTSGSMPFSAWFPHGLYTHRLSIPPKQETHEEMIHSTWYYRHSQDRFLPAATMCDPAAFSMMIALHVLHYHQSSLYIKANRIGCHYLCNLRHYDTTSRTNFQLLLAYIRFWTQQKRPASQKRITLCLCCCMLANTFTDRSCTFCSRMIDYKLTLLTLKGEPCLVRNNFIFHMSSFKVTIARCNFGTVSSPAVRSS